MAEIEKVNPDGKYLQEKVQMCIDKGIPPAKFFEIFLLPYFNDAGPELNMGSGLDVRVGHFFYNLSTLIPLIYRLRMPIAQTTLGDGRADLAYDKATNEIIPLVEWKNKYGERSTPPRAHFSLEAWRKMWEGEQGGLRVPMVNVRTHRFDRYLGFRFQNNAETDLRRIKEPSALCLMEVSEDEVDIEITQESEEEA